MVWKNLEQQELRRAIMEILKWKAKNGLCGQKASKIKRKEHEFS
jgi:hypothetical protein